MSAAPGGTPSFVVTLVHGTFARSAGWTKPSSALCTALKERLPGEVSFESFAWSGANSHRDRLEAGERLNRQLKSQLAQAPGASHAVVGHSHGGNVALYTAKQAGLDGELASIICLNTPFVCVTPRSVASLLYFSFLLLVGFLLIGAGVSAAVGFGLGRTDWNYYKAAGAIPATDALNLAAAWGFCLIALSAAVLLVRKRRSIHALIKQRQGDLISYLSLPDLDKTRVVCLWTASDEVYGTFSVLEGLSTLPYILLHPIFIAGAFAATACMFLALHFLSSANALWLGVGSSNYVLAFVGYANEAAQAVAIAIDRLFGLLGATTSLYLDAGHSYSGHPLQAVLVSLFQAFFQIFYLSLAALAAALVLNVLLRLLPMGLGGYRFIDSLFVRLSFTLVPVTARRISFRDVSSERGLLNHSMVYNDTAVLDALVETIQEDALRHGAAKVASGPSAS
jgi:hypothetical protein